MFAAPCALCPNNSRSTSGRPGITSTQVNLLRARSPCPSSSPTSPSAAHAHSTASTCASHTCYAPRIRLFIRLPHPTAPLSPHCARLPPFPPLHPPPLPLAHDHSTNRTGFHFYRAAHGSHPLVRRDETCPRKSSTQRARTQCSWTRYIPCAIVLPLIAPPCSCN